MPAQRFLTVRLMPPERVRDFFRERGYEEKSVEAIAGRVYTWVVNGGQLRALLAAQPFENGGLWPGGVLCVLLNPGGNHILCRFTNERWAIDWEVRMSAKLELMYTLAQTREPCPRCQRPIMEVKKNYKRGGAVCYWLCPECAGTRDIEETLAKQAAKFIR